MNVVAPITTVECDFRDKWAYTRDQGLRQTCLAIAVSDMNALSHAEADALSVEALLSHAAKYLPSKNSANGLTHFAADQALRHDGQPLEVLWPYDSIASNKLSAEPCEHWFGTVDDSAISDTDFVNAFRKFQAPMLLVIRVTRQFQNTRVPAVIPATVRGHALHAVIAVGLGSDASGKNFILIRNSWGPGWGDAGHAWLYEDYLKDNFVSVFTVSPKGKQRK